jgi:hypothetical protein
MSVRPSVRPYGTVRFPPDEFSWKLIFEEFSKNLSRKYNLTRITVTCAFMIISRWIIFKMINVSDKSCTGNQNTILGPVTTFRKSCRLWHNVEKCGIAKLGTYDNIIRRMRFACWITKATDTLRMCNTCCFSTSTVVTRTRLCYVVRALPVLLQYLFTRFVCVCVCVCVWFQHLASLWVQCIWRLRVSVSCIRHGTVCTTVSLLYWLVFLPFGCKHDFQLFR